MITTLIVNYRTKEDKERFLKENENHGFDRVIYVQNSNVDGCKIDILETN